MSNARGRCFRARRRTAARKARQAAQRRLEWLKREAKKLHGIGIPAAVDRWSLERLEREVASARPRRQPKLSADMLLAAIAANELKNEHERSLIGAPFTHT
jgi:hypothetical protein